MNTQQTLDLTQPVQLGNVHYVSNHDRARLSGAVWHPYPLGESYLNPKGNNGYVTGKVVNGSTTSRLFQYSVSKDWIVGSEKRIDYATLGGRLWQTHTGDWYFDNSFCG